MKLLRLHIHGFKSFKDRTTINFDEGITGIVGPNGCGKSNIVDALFWVMGEQSAKHLRGTSMKDVIFSGSDKYSPATWAEVTLVLLNEEGKHIHIGNQVHKPQEIQLTRKLYRNGETEYRINGVPARLKDIHEVFMDTGAGAKSYSIIAQGEINKLVQQKPEERRVMIEEVAGITKFKLRKRDSLKKIEHTTENINRINDLKEEIYKNLKAVEKQKEKAERARYLKEKVKKHELIVESHRELDYLTDFIESNQTLITNAHLLEEASLRKVEIETTLEDERVKKDTLEEQIESRQDEYNQEAKLLAAAEERIKHLKKAYDEKNKQVTSKTSENEEIILDIQNRKLRLGELKAEQDNLISMDYGSINFEELEEKVTVTKEQHLAKETELSEHNLELQKFKEELNDTEQLLFRNTSKTEEFATQLQDITTEVENIEKQFSQNNQEILNLKEKYKKLKVEHDELKTNNDLKKSELLKFENEFKEIDQKLKEITREVIKLDSKKQSLVEVSKSGEGLKAGGKQILEKNPNGLFQFLGQLIECQKEYAQAVETLFEGQFSSIISKANGKDELLTSLNQIGDISLDFLKLENQSTYSEETLERMKLKGANGVIALSDIIKINDAEFNNVLTKLFQGYYLIQNLNSELALKLAQDLNFKAIASYDGLLVMRKDLNGDKLSLRKSDELIQGDVQRNNQIHEITLELEEKLNQQIELETKYTALNATIIDLKAQLEIGFENYNKISSEYITVKSTLEAKESTFNNSSDRLQVLTLRKQELSKQRLSMLETGEELKTLKGVLSDKVSQRSLELENLRTIAEEVRMQYEQVRDDFLALQASARTFDAQKKNLESQIMDAESQIERYEAKIEANGGALERLNDEINELETNISTLADEISTNSSKLSEEKDALDLVKDEFSELLIGMQEREAEVKKLTQTISKIEKANVEHELKVNQIKTEEELLVKDIFERHRIDLRDVIKLSQNFSEESIVDLKDISNMYSMMTAEGEVLIEKTEYNFEKRFPAQVKESKEKFRNYKSEFNRLGEINWQAIEDYDRQKLRYDFLKSQEEELKKSLVDLQNAINHIDEKSKVRFKEAFEEVNSRFSKVFPIIFGGGNAKLEITGDLNSPDCGIDIIAQPPGKKMQSITLMSGGEKAMTAVSLIFSIFLVKPSPFCLLDEVDAPLDDANVGRFNQLLREMSQDSQFILITHNKKTMELNDTLYGVTMQEPGVSKAVSVQLQ
jgi:chromosome segregation protein